MFALADAAAIDEPWPVSVTALVVMGVQAHPPDQNRAGHRRRCCWRQGGEEEVKCSRLEAHDAMG